MVGSRGIVGWCGIVGLFGVSLLVDEARAACPASAEWVRQDAQAAYTASAKQDMASFERAIGGLQEDVGCLTEPITSADAAQAHLAFALRALQASDTAQAVSSFRALLAAQPGYVPDDAVAPLGSPARAAFDEARTKGPGETSPVPAQPGYTWVVDGTSGPVAMLSKDRATIISLQGADGSIVKSYYFPAGAMPDALVGAQQVAVGAVIIGTKNSDKMSGAKPLSRYLAYGAGGGAVASGISLVVAAAIKGSYLNAPDTDGELTGKLHSNHAMGITGYALGGLAIGTAGAAVVIGRW